MDCELAFLDMHTFTYMKHYFDENTRPCHVPDRKMDEPFLIFDFEEIIHKIKTEGAWQNGDRNAVTLLKNSSVSVVLIALKRGAEINFHHTGKMASVQVLEGSAHFKTKSKTALLKTAGFVTLHEQVEHILTAAEESVILLTMTIYPID
jgi:quercetin dioxygenase-like cupin family protein